MTVVKRCQCQPVSILWRLWLALLSLQLILAAVVLPHNVVTASTGGTEKTEPQQKQQQQVVLITGCSTGIGEAVALEFAKRPEFKVYATMRDPQKWKHPPQDNIVLGALDVVSDSSVAAMVESIVAKEGKIDVLVNNAGYGMAGTVEMVTVQEAKDLFEVNVWGVVRMLHAVLPHMRERRKGHIINISSTSGIRGIPCMEFYTGSKFALEGITDSMRYSLAPYGIFVTNVNAGPIRTAFTDRFGNAAIGGRGTRAVPKDDFRYLTSMTDKLVEALNKRMVSSEGQSAEEAAQVIANVAILGLGASKISDVPFNTGTSLDSQKVLQQVRRHPSGWGGVYSTIIKSVSPLPRRSDGGFEL